ncbi:MAG TPA: antiterminator Q family protein [Cellvibrionaceae bacterium]
MCKRAVVVSETEELLINWGLWNIYRVPGQYTSSILSVMHLVGGKSGQDAQISDDEALRVDSACARLKQADKALYELLELRYIKRLPIVVIGLRVGADRRVVTRRIAGAITYLDCILNPEAIAPVFI